MIRSLRQYHRRIVISLSLFLPTAFAVGITLRQPVPSAELPGTLAPPPSGLEPGAWQPGWFAKTGVRVRGWRGHPSARQFALEFSAAKDFLKPDLLVYWAAGHPVIADTLPDNARLLGSFAVPTLPVPSELTTNTGVLVLYSLADAAIVDVSQAVQFNDLPR